MNQKRNVSKPAAQGRRTTENLDTVKLDQLLFSLHTASMPEALIELIQLSKQKRVQAWLLEQSQTSYITALLKNEKPKIRKNAARLLGNLQSMEYQNALISALVSEETLFVVPSIFLALGRLEDSQNNPQVKATIEQYQSMTITDENKKNLTTILDAIDTAFPAPMQTLTFHGIPENQPIYAYAPMYCISLLEKEAIEKNIAIKNIQKKHIEFSANQYAQLFSLRCMQEALLPIGKSTQLPAMEATQQELDMWTQGIELVLQKFVKQTSAIFDTDAIHYRIETKISNQEQRKKTAQTIGKQIQLINNNMHNSTSQYQVELRILPEKENCFFYIKLFVPSDERFAYRQQALPASITPVSAACIAQFAKPYFVKNARVLDPCCGAGTMLIERALVKPIHEAVGIDKHAQAIAMARQNAQNISVPIELIGGKLEKFSPREPFDELIANLPFGTRVGTQSEIESLYESLFNRMRDFVKKDGIAILYTTHRKKIHQLAEQKHFLLLDEMCLDAGGMRPWAMILRI